MSRARRLYSVLFCALVVLSLVTVSVGVIEFGGSPVEIAHAAAPAGAESVTNVTATNTTTVQDAPVYDADRGWVFVPVDGDQDVIAVNMTTGTIEWTTDLSGVSRARAIDYDNDTDYVYIGADAGSDDDIYALHAENGTQVWSFDPDGVVATTARDVEATNGSLALAVYNDNGYHALDAETGVEQYTTTVDSQNGRRAVYSTNKTGIVYVGEATNDAGHVGKTHLGNGTVIATETFPDIRHRSLATLDGFVYHIGDGYVLRAPRYDLSQTSSSELRWEDANSNNNDGWETVAAKHGYVLATEGFDDGLEVKYPSNGSRVTRLNDVAYAEHAKIQTSGVFREDSVLHVWTAQSVQDGQVSIIKIDTGVTITDTTTTTTDDGGGGGSSGGGDDGLAPDEYRQTFTLDSRTPLINPQHATMTVLYWETPGGERKTTSDPFGSVDADNVEVTGAEFDFRNQTTVTLHDDVSYDIIVRDESCGGYWRGTGFIADKDGGTGGSWQSDGTFTLIVTDRFVDDRGAIGCGGSTATALPGTRTPASFPTSTPLPPHTSVPLEPELEVSVIESVFEDCWAVRVSYFDPAMETTRINYSFDVENTTYTDTITFDRPIAFFSDTISQQKFDPDAECSTGLPDIPELRFDANRTSVDFTGIPTFSSGQDVGIVGPVPPSSGCGGLSQFLFLVGGSVLVWVVGRKTLSTERVPPVRVPVPGVGRVRVPVPVSKRTLVVSGGVGGVVAVGSLAPCFAAQAGALVGLTGIGAGVWVEVFGGELPFTNGGQS